MAGDEVEVGDSIGPWVGMLGSKGVGDGSAATVAVVSVAGVGVAGVGAAGVGVSGGWAIATGVGEVSVTASPTGDTTNHTSPTLWPKVSPGISSGAK